MNHESFYDNIIYFYEITRYLLNSLLIKKYNKNI